jgi:DNA-binding PadR family transcriptional regulator
MFREEHESRYPRRPMRNHNWMRHNAMVPKGFLRYHVLEAISEKPISGSEIMEQIGKHTGGFWKPSPGSIYPLLAWLQDNNFIKELPLENGLKRYELTEIGKALFEEQKKIRKKIQEEGGFLNTPFFENFLTKMDPNGNKDFRESMKRLAIAFFRLSSSLQEHYSEELMKETQKIVNEVAEKFEEMNKKIYKTKGEQ